LAASFKQPLNLFNFFVRHRPPKSYMPPYKPSNALYFQPNERAENCFIVSNITKLSKGLFLVRLFLVTSITIKSTKRKNTVAYFLPLFRIYKYETPFILINVCSKFNKKQQNTTPHFSFLFYIKNNFFVLDFNYCKCLYIASWLIM